MLTTAEEIEYLTLLNDEDMFLTKERERQWRSGDLNFILHRTQRYIDRVVRASNSKEILVFSSRQLGKSWWVVCYALSFALQNPGKLVRIYAPVLDKLQDIVNDNLLKIVATAPEGLIKRVKSDYRWVLHNGAEIRLGTLDTAHTEGNRGGNASLIIVEEGSFVTSDHYRYVRRSVIGPQRLRSKGRIIVVTTPSPDVEHYLHTVTKPQAEAAGVFFNFTIWDNPQLDDEQLKLAQEDCGIGPHNCTRDRHCPTCRDSEDWVREYLAEVVRSHSSVLVPEFDKSKHVVNQELPPHLRWTLAVDFGFAKDLSSAVLMYFDFTRNKRVVWDSIVWDRGINTRDIVAALKELELKWGITKAARFFDESARIRSDIAIEHDYPFVEMPTKDDRDAQINKVRVGFSLGEIEVNPRCSHLILTLENARWKKQRTDFERTKTLGHADSFMALVYADRMQDKTNPYPHLYHLNPATQNVTIKKPTHSLVGAFQPKF